MIPEDDLASKPCSWLKVGGPESDVVVSTRVRLARNIRGFPMPWRMSPEQRTEVDAEVGGHLEAQDLGEPLRVLQMTDLAPRHRLVLVERNLVSRELAEGDGRRAAYITPSERLSIMTLEEDHLRLQALRPGLQIDDAWQQINGVDNKLEKALPYAVSEQLGYLTSCPTNVGTGLRLSVMLHLPILAHTQQIEKVATAAAKVGLVLRGHRGEGSEAKGDLHQVSNQVTLGRSEDEIRDDLQKMVAKIVEWERGLRRLVFRQNRVEIEDRVWRAWGTLRYARRINTEETLANLSALRLGFHLDLISAVDLQTINDIFLFTQPAHLQSLLDCDLAPPERDQHRATFIRERLDR